ncbi:MAG: VPLPA-CTERM sorting domain-containing protein [Nitrospira sp.]
MAPITFLLTFGVTVFVAIFGSAGFTDAMVVTQLELTGGSTSYDGRFSRVADRLLDRDGTILIGQYQPMQEIVAPITKGHRTFSLFTSGVQGADAPSATINGSSITVDLSSLFFGVSRGESLRAWNIGGLAQGVFNPETSEFSLSWTHVFDNGEHKEKHGWQHDDRIARFFLQGKALGLAPTPVPLPASLLLFAGGFMGLGGLAFRKRRALATGATA